MPVLRKVPPLPDVQVPMFLDNGAMNPIWRQFFVHLRLLLEEMKAIIP